MKAGDAARAEPLFARAVELAPDVFDFRLNHAIALNSLRRFAEAEADLVQVEQQGRGKPAYCSTRASCARGLGRLADAARWYDAALALDPGRTRALHGRARVALERDEADALARFDAALAVNPGDADLWLGKAQVLDTLGDRAGARLIAEQLVDQAPQWTDGLRFLAQLRLAAGEADFASHYANAAKRVPQDPNIPAEWAQQLASLDFNAEAAAVANRAGAAFPQLPQFALFEAVYAGAAGDEARAETLFATITEDSPHRWMQEGRHALRLGQLDRAELAFERSLDTEPANIGTWGLRGIGWRLTGDPRAEWLHEQAGLVQLVALPDGAAVLAETVPLLHRLHDRSAFPLGQSLRGGTQTRGGLFDRTEPELARLQADLMQALELYRAALPAVDETQPLLRHRASPWRIKGSWSVRLSAGSDHHTAHIHPAGIVSSALYCDLPDELPDQAGWLELGRPPPDLRIDLPPLQVIEPKVGHLALFPSTLYHGTRPFGEGRRMTVAFDVVGQ